MFEAHINGRWQKVYVVSVGRRGVTVSWEKAYLRIPWPAFRWVTDDWYEHERYTVS